MPNYQIKKDLFADFDFSQDEAVEREEREFMAQYKSTKVTYNVGLMCTKTGWLMSCLTPSKGA